MKTLTRSLLVGALLGAAVVYADGTGEGDEVAAATTGATYDADTATLTLDGVITNVTEEADLGDATTVVMKNGGGVAFTSAAATNLLMLAKTYTIAGDGLAATGVLSVAEGVQVTSAAKATLVSGTLGHVLVKRGAGTLELASGAGPNVVNVATRWIVEEGTLRQGGQDFFGNHSSTTTNLAVDVRAGATYYAFTGQHCPMGPLELTGGTMKVASNVDTSWAGTALRGGVVAHASARESFLRSNGDIHLNHVYEDVSFVVERGAVLTVEALLVNGFNLAASARVDNRLLVSGGGTLRLLSRNGFSGGVKVSDGTTLVLGNASALGTAQTLELDGNTTVEVLEGVTIPNLVLTGSGTLTKTGAGVLTVASQAAGVTVTRAEGEGTKGSSVVDGVLVLNDEDGLYTYARDVVIDVPTGSTLELAEIQRANEASTIYVNLTKTGGGTLVFAATNSLGLIGRAIVREGALQAADANKLPYGDIRLMNGSALVVTNSSERWGTITVKNEAVFDVAEGASFTVHSNWFNVAGTTLRKRGAGTLYFGPDVRFFKDPGTTGARLIAEEGTLQLGQDPFGGHSTLPASVVEVESGATLTAARHAPLGHVILRGGTIEHLGYPPYRGTGYNAMEDPHQDMTASDPWMGFSFNGTIEVQPSPDGRASVIRGSRFYAAHAANETVFDVAEGATLRLEGGRFDNGVGTAITQPKVSGFTKTGAGEFVLDLDAGLLGTVRLEEGTLTLGANGRLPDAARVHADPGTTLRLEDGATLGAGLEADDAFLFTADVWLDAARLLATPGARVTTVPNRGTAGGTFRQFTKSNDSYKIPTAPVYSNAVINGKGALFFDGGSALVLDAYTNRTATATVFMVAEWTTWSTTVGQGKWGGELSMGTATAANDDNNTAGTLHLEAANGIADTYVQAHSLADSLHADNANRAVGAPYLNEIALTGEKLFFRQYVGAAVEDATLQTGQYAGKTFAIDLVSVGGRLALGGMCQYFGGRTNGGNRMFIGHVGELLVFTRALTDDEKLRVRAYLKKKWFADETAALPETVAANTAPAITVDVPSGTAGLAGTWAPTADSARTGRPQLRKTGAGTLALRATVADAATVDVQAGTLELSGKAIPPRADVWFDATDAAAVTTNAEGRVTAVANKGRAGGAFGACPGRSGTTVPLPTYEAEGLAGKGAVAFDLNAGLSLDTYTNVGERAISVYFVAQRTAYEDVAGKGKWGGPFSFIGTSATLDDQQVDGALHVEEMLVDGRTRVHVFAGQYNDSRILESGALEDPYLMIVHQQAKSGAVAAFEWADTATNALETLWYWTSPTIDVNRVLLGGRGTTGGVMQWDGMNNGGNRTWSGRVGEMLVFTKPLSVAEQTALLAYLRAKWFAKGEGATAAPAFVGGAYGQPDLGSAATLRVAAGATVEQGGPTLALAALEAESGAAWRRVGAFADPLAYTLFDVSGALTFGANQALFAETVPFATVRLFGGAATSAATWTTTGDVTVGSRVVRRADGLYLLRDGGTVFFLR